MFFKVRQGAILKAVWHSRSTYGLLAHTGNHLGDIDERTCVGVHKGEIDVWDNTGVRNQNKDPTNPRRPLTAPAGRLNFEGIYQLSDSAYLYLSFF